MQVSGFQQFLTDNFARAALKQHIVRHNDRSLAGCFQNGIDVLHKVQLFVRTGCPEVLPVVNEVFFLLFAFLISKGDGGLFSERWIGQHIVHTITGVGEKRIPKSDRRIAVNITDVVQIQIHQGGFIGGRNDLISVKSFVFQKFLLLPVKGIMLRVGNVRLRSEEKSPGTTAGVCDDLHRLRMQTFYHCFNQRTRSEILSCTAFNIFGVFLEQSLIDFALNIRRHSHPFFGVDHLYNSIQNGGIADFVGCPLKNLAEDAALFTKFLQNLFIFIFQLCAFERAHIEPCKACWNTSISFIGRSGILIGHFQKN